MAEKLEKPDFNDWFITPEYRGDVLGSQLEWNLSKDINFDIPDIDFDKFPFKIPDELLELVKKPPKAPVIEDVTTGFRGTGSFDKLMVSSMEHLLHEYKNNRITGAEYAQAWVSGLNLCMTQAVNFELNRHKLWFELLLTNANTIAVLNNIYMSQVQLAALKAQAHNNRAQYCHTKLRLATEDTQYALVKENMESARAQTLDTRLSDNQTVMGSIGKQKDLYNQQIISFRNNDNHKLVNSMLNVWTAQKTVDEGTLVPDAATNDNISEALKNYRNKLQI